MRTLFCELLLKKKLLSSKLTLEKCFRSLIVSKRLIVCWNATWRRKLDRARDSIDSSFFLAGLFPATWRAEVMFGKLLPIAGRVWHAYSVPWIYDSVLAALLRSARARTTKTPMIMFPCVSSLRERFPHATQTRSTSTYNAASDPHSTFMYVQLFLSHTSFNEIVLFSCD